MARRARLPVGDVVVLAYECGAVATLAQHLGKHRRVLGNLAAVSGVAVALLRDDAGPGGMMVAPREQGCAGGGAEGRRMEARVAQTHRRQAIKAWCRNLSAECAPLSEPRIIDQDYQDVRCASGSLGESHRPRL